MIISNPRLAERGLSCCTTRFWVRLGLLVSYRTLAPLCRQGLACGVRKQREGGQSLARLAGKTSPRIRALVLYTFNKTTKHQTLR